MGGYPAGGAKGFAPTCGRGNLAPCMKPAMAGGNAGMAAASIPAEATNGAFPEASAFPASVDFPPDACFASLSSFAAAAAKEAETSLGLGGCVGSLTDIVIYPRVFGLTSSRCACSGSEGNCEEPRISKKNKMAVHRHFRTSTNGPRCERAGPTEVERMIHGSREGVVHLRFRHAPRRRTAVVPRRAPETVS